jgi:endogenous inhibitor of DNA gyrase (YacG/DUF329 family)
MASSKPPGAASGSCPVCGRPTDLHYRPFCSRRCADVDLSRWLRGAYAIPDKTESEDGEAPESDGQARRDDDAECG